MNATTLIASLLAATSVAALGIQQAPTRDAALSPTVGTASLSGTVVNDEERPQPVRRAIVTLNGDGLRPSRGAITDDAGRFSFTGLPAGRFTVTVSRASFITSVYGAKRPGRPGTPVAIADGARVNNLVVRLWRGAAVAGVLRDDTGAPVQGIEVRAVSARRSGPGLTLSNNGAVTNELGEFRIFGLEPGTYAVVAKPGAGGASQIIAMSEREIDAAIDALRRRTASGGSTMPTPTPTPASAPAQMPFDFAPVYYPGTTALSQAAPIALTSGQDLTGLNFSLQRVATAVVAGTVMRPDGTPAAGASVQMTAVIPAGGFSSDMPLQLDTTASADGTFRIAQVTPGSYQLIARAPADTTPVPPTPGIVTPGPTGASLWALIDVAVAGADVSGLVLSLDSGATFAGRFAFESETQKPPPDLSRVRVGLIPPSILALKDGTPIRSIAFAPPARVRADGTFDMVNVPPGRYRLIINGPPLDGSAWWARSAVADDRDLLDRDIDIGAGSSRAALQITFTDKRTELSGTLQGPGGAAASDVFVIAFTTDRRLWGSGARRVQAVRPGADGRFVVKDLPAGEYHLAAVTDIDQDEWQDPAFLEKLVPAAIKVSLADGEKRVQNLRIGG